MAQKFGQSIKDEAYATVIADDEPKDSDSHQEDTPVTLSEKEIEKIKTMVLKRHEKDDATPTTDAPALQEEIDKELEMALQKKKDEQEEEDIIDDIVVGAVADVFTGGIYGLVDMAISASDQMQEAHDEKKAKGQGKLTMKEAGTAALDGITGGIFKNEDS